MYQNIQKIQLELQLPKMEGNGMKTAEEIWANGEKHGLMMGEL
jgi:hypothetical protein